MFRPELEQPAEGPLPLPYISGDTVSGGTIRPDLIADVEEHTGAALIATEVEYKNTDRVTADAAEGLSTEDTDVGQVQNADALAASLTKKFRGDGVKFEIGKDFDGLIRWGIFSGFSEDEIGDTLLVMSRVGIENFEYAGQAMNFFQMTIRHKRLDTVRHDKRHPKESYDDPDANFSTPSTRQNIARELEADMLIISILSKIKSMTQREAVFVVDVLGMTPEDAAEDLGIKPGAFRTRLNRGRATLQNLVASGELTDPRTVR